MRSGAALLTFILCVACEAPQVQGTASPLAPLVSPTQTTAERIGPTVTPEPTVATTPSVASTAQPIAGPSIAPDPTPRPCDASAARESTGLRGRVIWQGAPVPGYRVELRAWDPPFEGTLYSAAMTDADGAFVLSGAPAGKVGLWIPRQPPYVFRGYSVNACGGRIVDMGDVETVLEITGLSIREGQVVARGPLTIAWDPLEQAERFCVGLFSEGRAVLTGGCDGHVDEVAVDGTSFSTPPISPGEYFFQVSAVAGGYTIGETQEGITGIVVR